MKKFLFLLILCEIWSASCKLSFAQNAKLTVPAEVTSDTVILNPQGSAPSDAEGRIYFNSTNHKPYYHDALAWKFLGLRDKVVTTKVVAAADSVDKEMKADYVCSGTETTGGDQVTIQSAIDSLGVAGGMIYLLEGNFWVSNYIKIPSNVSIIGTGPGTVITIKDAAPLNYEAVFMNSDQTHGNSNIIIQGLVIYGNSAHNSNIQYGIDFTKVSYSKINEVSVQDMGRSQGIGFYSSNNNAIVNTLEYGNYIGIYLETSNNNTLSGNAFRQNYLLGVYFSHSSYNSLLENDCIETVANDNIWLDYSTCNIISGNISYSSGSNGVCLEHSSTNNVVTGNNCQSNTEFGINMDTSSNGNIIVGNVSRSNRQYGIRIDASHYNTILGNVVYDNGQSGAYDGIRVQNSSNSNFISSNRVLDTAGPSSGTAYMINVAAANCNNNYITGNETSLPASYSGNLGQINDSGTSTTYTQKEKLTIERKNSVAPVSGDSLDVATYAKGYVPLAPTSAVTLNATTAIANGKSIGDMLYLEGTSDTYGVTVPNGANVHTVRSPTYLYQGDILMLIWNGAIWVELAHSYNSSHSH